jgi:DNA-dependent protein kinase catalytic subunit
MSLISLISISIKFKFNLLLLFKIGGKVLSDVLEFVIWQGILWTCSHQLTYDLQENIEDMKDWKEMITYRKYLPLWSQLINSKREEYKEISKLIFNNFVKNLFEIIEHLDLSTKKRIYTGENNVDFYFSDPSLDVEPIRPENFQILYNLVQFYTDIFKDFPKDFLEENFTEWLELWLDDVIRLSIKYPLISGFIQILELIVTLMMRLDYNNESVFNQNPSMVRNLESLNFFIKTNIFVRSTQYSGELQVSCLSLIFQLPTPILKNLIHEIPPIFITGFTIGRGMLDLAHRALSCFERIIETLSTDPNTKRRVLEQVLPCLESYLSSQDTGDSEVKKMFHGKKTKFVNQQTTTSDTDLMRFKKRILWLLGYFDLDDAQLILSKFEPKLVRNHITNVFRVKLDTNEEKILQIFLDDSVDKICDLALTSSERSIRISACELLHGLAVYMIGKSLDGPDTLPIFPNICRSLIILGADKDETVRQLFEPLLKQIVHFFSRSDKILSPMTTVLIESLMTMISCQSNSSIQDLSAILLNEFLQWMNRQCDRVQRKSSPINLVDLFHSMRKMSLETDASRRMGATMAFNNIYRIIREDEEIVDVYWIYLLEVFATNFK